MDTTETLEQSGEGNLVPETEQRARRLGWVPKDEFKGDPDRHRSAEEFLERGETMLPLLKRDNDRLHEKFGVVERELKETRETLKQFSEHSAKAEERAYKRAKAELEAKLDGAIATADVEVARQTRREIEDLNANVVVPPKKEEQPQLDPVIEGWRRENEWFDKSPSLRAYSIEVFGDLERQYPGKGRAELLAETKQKTMERFPDKFGTNPKREEASAVANPGGITPPRKKPGKNYDDLPPEAKKACDKFVKQIPGYTRDKYVKDYEWES